MHYNYFDDINKEYVIKNMYPKRPWLNYAWNTQHVACMNQFGFGMSRFSDGKGYLKDILCESDNRLIFIKDKKTKEFYAANRNYDNKEFDRFETQVGMGYSIISSEYKGLMTELKIFVPTKGLIEFWEVKIKNSSPDEKEISLYSYADVDMSITGHVAYTSAEFSKKLNGIYCEHKAYRSPTSISGVFFASNGEINSFETTNRRFKGVYSDIGHPVALNDDTLANCGTCFENEVAAVMQFELTLKPGECKTLLFALGASADEEEACRISKSVLDEEVFENEFKMLQASINDFQNNIVIETPDPEINRRINIWLKRQIEMGKQWGRMYGKGFRDIMQDVTAFLPLDPDNARARILYALQYQREDGNPVRQWDPYVPEVYVDGSVWMIYAINVYLKETKDFSILDEKVCYYESDIKETVLEHCIRGISFEQNNLGEHGLCLWGEGDWNDSINGCGGLGVGESVWLSEATVKAANELMEFLKAAGKEEYINDIGIKADKMKENILKYGWDRDHFIYGINDYHEKIGGYEAEEGKVFMNPQTWAVLSGIVTGDDAKNVMNVVENELSCDYGYVLQKSAYHKGTDKIGRASYFKPGCYENASVYNHGVAFKIVADCLLGEGDRAYGTIKKILPDNPKNSYEQSGVEPYAMSNMYLGPECESRRGEAPLSWITGTCGWLFRGVVEYILGISADFDGLKITPNLPHAWDTVKVKRVFRDCEYNITFDNVHCGDDFEIYVDGSLIEGNVICEDGKDHEVIVRKK